MHQQSSARLEIIVKALKQIAVAFSSHKAIIVTFEKINNMNVATWPMCIVLNCEISKPLKTANMEQIKMSTVPTTTGNHGNVAPLYAVHRQHDSPTVRGVIIQSKGLEKIICRIASFWGKFSIIFSQQFGFGSKVSRKLTLLTQKKNDTERICKERTDVSHFHLFFEGVRPYKLETLLCKLLHYGFRDLALDPVKSYLLWKTMPINI